MSVVDHRKCYDDFGNLTQTAAPLNRTTSPTYDANGNKLTDTDANGHSTGYHQANSGWITAQREPPN